MTRRTRSAGLFSSLAVLGLALQQSTVGAQPGSPINPEVQKRIVTSIYDALGAEPQLRGAFIAFRPAGTVWSFQLWVDRDRAEEQTAAIGRLLERTLAPGTYIIDPSVTRLPVSELLRQLRDEIDETPKLAGTQLYGISFDLPRKEGNARNAARTQNRDMRLFGRVPPPGPPGLSTNQRIEELQKICYRLLDGQHEWADLRQIVDMQVRVDVKSVDPSGFAAQIDYSDGIALFWAGRYDDATRAFSDALVEDPGNTHYLYWKALAEIGAGNTERAYRIIRPLVQERRGSYVGPFNNSAPLQFERVQGPIRSALHDLERRALLDPIGMRGR